MGYAYLIMQTYRTVAYVLNIHWCAQGLFCLSLWVWSCSASFFDYWGDCARTPVKPLQHTQYQAAVKQAKMNGVGIALCESGYIAPKMKFAWVQPARLQGAWIYFHCIASTEIDGTQKKREFISCISVDFPKTSQRANYARTLIKWLSLFGLKTFQLYFHSAPMFVWLL